MRFSERKICEAEKTTFLGSHLECERAAGHRSAHLDIDQGVYWIDSEDTDRLAQIGPINDNY